MLHRSAEAVQSSVPGCGEPCQSNCNCPQYAFVPLVASQTNFGSAGPAASHGALVVAMLGGSLGVDGETTSYLEEMVDDGENHPVYSDFLHWQHTCEALAYPHPTQVYA